jgi:transposase
MDKDSLKLFLDQGLSLEEIGRRVGGHPSTVGYWVRKHGLTPANQAKQAARGGISRERLAILIEEGHSLVAIGRLLGVSATTVRHWVSKYELKTARSERVRHGRQNRADGRAIVQMRCSKHGLTDFWLEGRRLPVHAVSGGGGGAPPEGGSGHAALRAWRLLCHLRVLPLRGRAALPPPRPGDQAIQRQGRPHAVPRSAARRGREMRSSMQ